MKYKKFKYNNYKGVSRKSGNKKALIITLSIIAAVLLIAAAVIVTVTLVNKSNADKLEKERAQVVAIQISRAPDKTTYYCGDIFDSTGMIVYTLTKGNDFTKVDVDKCTITGFDSSAPTEKQVITVTYNGFSDTFNIKIKEETPTVPMLESITVETLPKTEYKYGEGPDMEGGVLLCTYTDGTTKKIELKLEYISGFMPAMMKGPGEYDITVKYTENGIQATTTYKITISE